MADIDRELEAMAARYGVSPRRLRAIMKIESGGNPSAKTGSYKGLFQLSDSEFNRYGGGNIYSPQDNMRAGALKLKAEAEQLKRDLGREPTDAEIYMVHQQGWGGAKAHWQNPDKPAWQNMASTGEGRQKGEGWAKKAIWGNVPSDVRKKYGSVDNLTSRDFTNLWATKIARFGGDAGPAAAPVQVASAEPVIPDVLKAGYGRESGANSSLPVNVASAAPGAATEALPWSPAPSGGAFSLGSLGGSKGPMGAAGGVMGAFGSLMGGGGGDEAGQQELANLERGAQQANAGVMAESEQAQVQALKELLARRKQGAFA